MARAGGLADEVLRRDIGHAYDATGVAWADGPMRVYGPMAEELCARSPLPLAGRRLLDVGAGTGAVGAVARRHAAHVVAVDLSVEMLVVDAPSRPPGVAADVAALPFRDGVFDLAVAAFSLNHVADPVGALAEMARVVRAGGAVVAGAYAGDDDHPVKSACDAAAAELGWRAPAWYGALRRGAVPALGTVESATDVVAAAGLAGGRVDRLRIALPGLEVEDLVRWRLGLAHLAPFVASLGVTDRCRLVADCAKRLGDHPPPLVRSVIVITSCRGH